MEERITNSSTGGQKGQKVERFDLLPPVALRAVAAHFGRGARKYEDRNWELGVDWSLSFAAMQRHLWSWWGGEDEDEIGSHHLAAVAWHALVLLTYALDPHYAELDDRPTRSAQ